MSNKIIKFALFGNTYQPEKSASLLHIINKLNQFSSVIAIEDSFHKFVAETLHIDFTPHEIITSSQPFSADYAISIGGDGTFLKTSEMVNSKEIPIIGVNTGRLGFLADITPETFPALLEQIYEGSHHNEQRSLLNVSTTTPISLFPNALNEIAILKHDNSSMISIQVYMNGQYLNTYQSDGLIIATPTGSTGYNLSVGGPIVHPTSRSFILSPVAAHSLTVRPMIINDDATLEIKVMSRNNNFLLSIDGRSLSLPDNTTLTVSRSSYYINIVRIQEGTYFNTLRNKLMWGADNRH